jgi:capsular exopolysaccharide synthesis family protein
MSRIHDILTKAERDGTVRRTQGGVVPEPAAPPGGPPAAVTATVVDERAPATPVPLRPRPGAEPVPRAARVVDAGHLSPVLVAALTPHAVAAEQYRTLRTRIMLGEDGQPRRVLLVTSPGEGDGKSVTAANLALTMAQEFNRRIILVDGDLRRPGVHQLLGLPSTPGLADVLSGNVELDDAIVDLPEFNLTVLPSGLTPERPAELLGSVAMRRTLDALRTRFDRVLVDMPPVVPLADVGVLAPQVDGVLLVVRAGSTKKPDIERALSVFDGSRIVGLVLNATGGSQTGYSPYEAAAAAPVA